MTTAEPYTTICVPISLRDRLNTIRGPHESYKHFIERLLDEKEKRGHYCRVTEHGSEAATEIQSEETYNGKK